MGLKNNLTEATRTHKTSILEQQYNDELYPKLLVLTKYLSALELGEIKKSRKKSFSSPPASPTICNHSAFTRAVYKW